MTPDKQAIKQGEHIASQLMEAGYSSRGAAFSIMAALVCVASNAEDFAEFLSIKDKALSVIEEMTYDWDNPHVAKKKN